MPQPVPCRSARACAPRISASEQVPKPDEERPRAHPRSGACFTSRSSSSVSRSGSSVDWAAAPVRGPDPTSTGREWRAARPRPPPGPPREVEERARFAEGGRAGAEHLEAGELGGRRFLLGRDGGVERHVPVRHIAVHGHVVGHETAREMLGEMHVGVDESGEDEAAPAVDHAGHRRGGPHVGGAPHLHDALAVDEHGAVEENPARGIHGDDDACSTRIIAGRSSEQLERLELDGLGEPGSARDCDDPVQPVEVWRPGLEAQHGPEVVLRRVDGLAGGEPQSVGGP